MSPTQAPARFIPYSSSDIVDMCLADGELPKEEQPGFYRLYELLSRQFGLEALDTVKQIKGAYRQLDPDTDLRNPDLQQVEKQNESFETLLNTLLNRANFDQVSEQAIEDSLGDSSIFKVRLKIDFSQYEEVLLFNRGVSTKTEEVSSFFGLKKEQIEFINFDRVLIFIRLRSENSDSKQNVLLRLFQNVPRADLEMLFPETQVGLRLIDKLMIGIPAVISGIVVISTKLGATLILLGSLLGFYLGLHSDPVTLDKAKLIAIGAGLGALGGYIWKQFSNFKNRKLKFTQTLTSNLYFKLLDTNAGVFHRIADNSLEEELKEALLAYFFLWQNPRALTATELDETIQTWFKERWNCELDFEVDDALQKLKRLGLASELQTQEDRKLWKCIKMEEAVTTLEGHLKNI